MNELDKDELTVEQLDNVMYGFENIEDAYKSALEHPELYGEEAMKRLIEAQIKREEVISEENEAPKLGR